MLARHACLTGNHERMLFMHLDRCHPDADDPRREDDEPLPRPKHKPSRTAERTRGLLVARRVESHLVRKDDCAMLSRDMALQVQKADVSPYCSLRTQIGIAYGH